MCAKATDPRLYGTWQSDRRKSFAGRRPWPRQSAASFRRFKELFGKLLVTWGRTKVRTMLDDYEDETRYDVVAKDSVSVVIRYFDNLSEESRLQYIHFEGERYWTAMPGGMCEYFRLVDGRTKEVQ